MNREIEFRCWYDNQIYKVVNIDFSHKRINLFGADIINFNKGILMQYTGLKDKNGKKIFEGDIMKNKQGGIGIVKYSKYAEFILDFIDDIFVSSFNQSILRRYEVIGNIYENNLERKGEQ